MGEYSRDKKKLLPLRMSAFWFTYIAIFLFALLPNYNIELGLVEIFGYSAIATVLVNGWNWYKDKPLMDKRKQELVTEAMAWGFIAVSLALIPAGTTGGELDTDLIRDTASFGLWVWLLVFFLNILYQRRSGN